MTLLVTGRDKKRGWALPRRRVRGELVGGWVGGPCFRGSDNGRMVGTGLKKWGGGPPRRRVGEWGTRFQSEGIPKVLVELVPVL